MERRKKPTASPVHRAAMLPQRWPQLCWLSRQGTGRRKSDRRGRARKRQRQGVEKERRGMRGKSTKLASSPPEEGAPQGCLALFSPLGLGTRLFITKETRKPVWGKDKSLTTRSPLCLDGRYPYQAVWSLSESLSIVSSTQTSLSLSPALPLPPAYLLVTGASFSRVPKHILHGINREYKVAHPFPGSFREAWVWGDCGNLSLSYLARYLQIGPLRQRNGGCFCSRSLFREWKMMPVST